jgi:uncharacterized protein
MWVCPSHRPGPLVANVKRERTPDPTKADRAGTPSLPTPAEVAKLDNLEIKRRRFEEAGKFPMRRVVITGIVAFVVLFGAMAGYQRFQKSKEVGGIVVMKDPKYPSFSVEMRRYDDASSNPVATQTPEGISFPVATLTKDYIIGVTYKRTAPMPYGYQQAAGGNILPLLAYIAPSGRLVTATSFCEPCRSVKFHFEGNQLVCDTCFTRWDLNTLLGVAGGCVAYPPEEVSAEVRGDQIFMPKADLEAWVPRGYEDLAGGPTMSTTTTTAQ